MIFLKKTMLEELYIKIKEYDSDIVICNSQNFEKKKWWKKFYEKNYLINDNIIKQKTFLSLDIEKDFFNLFIYNLGINFLKENTLKI